jgi:predicted phage terminase large subunit-like protein
MYRRALLLRREQRMRLRRKVEQRSLIHYIRRIWPWFVIEEIHLLLAGYIEALVFGDITRLMQFMQPRSGKSLIGSVATPGFYLGNYPARRVMQVSHSAELSIDFGREAKDIVASEDFRQVFPGVELRADAKASGRWFTNKRGAYYASGVGGGIAGKGFHFGSADDLLNEQTAFSDVANQRVLNWWGPGFYTRSDPDHNAIMLTMTRWRKNDIAGHLLQKAKEDREADRYEVLRIPSILDEATAELLNGYADDPLLSPSPTGKPLRFKAGDSFAPRRWPLKKIKQRRANMASKHFEAIFMQNPTEDEGAIIKRVWWRKWPGKEPLCQHVIQVYDTAFEEEEMGIARSGKQQSEPAYSARTTWGVFNHQDHQNIVRPCVILLERWRARVGFPDLRQIAWRAYRDFKPDRVLIEKKASGHSLIQELRRKGVPLKELPVGRGSSKTARAHAASVVPEQGCVFYMDRDWAKDVIDECAEFPFGAFNDLADTAVHAWLWLRRTMWVQLGDEEEEVEEQQPERRPFG